MLQTVLLNDNMEIAHLEGDDDCWRWYDIDDVDTGVSEEEYGAAIEAGLQAWPNSLVLVHYDQIAPTAIAEAHAYLTE